MQGKSLLSLESSQLTKKKALEKQKNDPNATPWEHMTDAQIAGYCAPLETTANNNKIITETKKVGLRFLRRLRRQI